MKFTADRLRFNSTSEMSDYDEENYYDDVAEVWEGGAFGGSSGGGGLAKKKKKAKPTTVGRQRVGGAQAWGSSETLCPKTCTKKCCAVKSSTPVLYL